MNAVPSRVLVLINARIGDTLLITPAIRAVRVAHPQARITVLAHWQRAPLLRGLDTIDELRPIRKVRLGFERLAQRARYDWAICYGDDARLLRYCMAVARETAAFAPPASEGPGVRAVARPAALMHAVDERLLLAQAFGVPASGKRLDYRVTVQERAAADTFLRANGLQDRAVVVLQVASYPGKAYRDWPIESFVALVAQLARAHPELAFAVMGDAASRARAQQLVSTQPSRVHDWSGRFDLRQTAALLERARLYVGVDTGPTHLAGALGVPMVGLYHCYHRGRFLAPLEHAALRVIEHPRTDDDCERVTPMSEISMDRVVEACNDLLGRPDTRGGTTG